jgi:hypothetical protein
VLLKRLIIDEISGELQMKILECAELLNAKVIVMTENSDIEISVACGSDLMSDVMAFSGATNQMMLTGLVNPQTIRTAEMLDVKIIVFVRGKVPDENMCDLARDKGISLLSTPLTLFTSCGILYKSGIRGKEEAI